MKYIFIGEDGSMGYRNGKTYLGDMRVRQFTWFVPFNPFRKKVPYKNQTKFHDNWLEKNGDDRRYESVRLANVSEKIMRFPGIDLIAENHQKIMEIDATTSHILVLPSDKFKSRVKIGKLFGMPVYADPNVPKDKFLIEQDMEEQE